MTLNRLLNFYTPTNSILHSPHPYLAQMPHRRPENFSSSWHRTFLHGCTLLVTSGKNQCPRPSHASLYHAVITSPDSAPAPDGIPYSAWRICPRTTTQALENHFQSILTRTASPPLQSLVFIPKADQGEYADNYRPLGLPNTCDRILDRSVFSHLDNAMHSHSVLLSDLAKAFERVNPHWIMHVLVARANPYWILTYCRHILFGRKVHKTKSHFRPPLAIHNGVDMGRAFSVLLFCVRLAILQNQEHGCVRGHAPLWGVWVRFSA